MAVVILWGGGSVLKDVARAAAAGAVTAFVSHRLRGQNPGGNVSELVTFYCNFNLAYL